MFALLAGQLVERTDDVPVDLLERTDLAGRVAFVRGFIGRFDVDTDQVDRRIGEQLRLA